jgi:hypothetical protein
MDGASMKVNKWNSPSMDRWCDYDYGYIPASPLADFWREHDARQRATRKIRNSAELAALIERRRQILKDRNSGNQKEKEPRQ